MIVIPAEAGIQKDKLLETLWIPHQVRNPVLFHPSCPKFLVGHPVLPCHSRLRGNDREKTVIARVKESNTSLRGAERRSNLFLKEKFMTGKYEGNKWG